MIDKDILVIVPIYKKVSNDFYKIIGKYDNILLLDNNIIDKNTLPNSNNKFKLMKFSEEWGDYVLKSKYKKFTFIDQDNICKDNVNSNNIYDRVVTFITNYLFRSQYKHVFNRLLIFDRNNIKDFLNMPLNGFKSNIEIIDYARKNEIELNESDYIVNTNFKNKLNSLKVIMPQLLRSLISYLISIIVFLLLYYFIKINNNLEHTLVANFFAGVVGVVILILLDYKPYFQRNRLKDNIIYLLIYLVKISISGYIIYLLYNLIGIEIVISKILSDLLLLIGVEIVQKKIPFSI